MRTPARILVALAPAFAVALLLPQAAFADFLTPENGGSDNADAIDTLYKVVFAMAMVILAGVWAALLYSMVKFRARRGAVPAQIRGNTRLEIGWTVGAALVLVVLAVVTFVMLDDIRNAPESDRTGVQLQRVGQPTGTPDTEAVPPSGRSLRIQVNGLQYVWRFTYADDDDNLLNNAFSYEEMVVPVDTTVTLEIKAQDVVHSWWIPELGGKMDAVPGHTNWTWFKIPGKHAGRTFRGQCAELCGRNHANMLAHVRAVTPEEYEAFIEQRKREIKESNDEAARQRKRIEAEESR
ncbi:MAG TPA: cytochrome c oxidase subunit II [Solirubrobacteraceae bacterium]|nr:cytochrome c oxidase subunit II [Solirubrobacteraceae bacterium]